MTKDKYFEWRKLGFIAQNDLGIIDANLISKINNDDDIFDIIDFFNKFGAPEGLGHQDNYIYLKQDKHHDIHELRIFTDLEEEKEYFNLEENFANEFFPSPKNKNLHIDLKMKKTGEFEISSGKLIITDRGCTKDEMQELSKIPDKTKKVLSHFNGYLLKMKNGMYETYNIYASKGRTALDKKDCLIHFKCCNKFAPFDYKILYRRENYEWIHCADCDKQFGGREINNYFFHKESKELINFNEFCIVGGHELKPVKNKVGSFYDWRPWGVDIRPKDDIHHFCDVIRPKDSPKKNNYLDYFNPVAQQDRDS